MVDLNIKLPEDFLCEEERCEFKVTQKRKEVWAVELDLLNQFDKVCKKHDIQYMAIGGTLLGAVRHKGFIPWDDDIDVAMTRENYDKLCSVSQEFSEPYLLQYFKNDKVTLSGAKLRNINTTALLRTHIKSKVKYCHNEGIFIDIFPLDNLPDDEKVRDRFVKKLRFYRKWVRIAYALTDGYIPKRADLKRQIAHFLYKCFFAKKYSCDSIFEKFINESKKYNGKDTKLMGMLNFVKNDERFWFKSDDFKQLKKVEFEFTEIYITENYDNALKQMYGNYMKYVVGGSWHEDVIFDTNIAYEQYIKKIPENEALV
ncbi:MAG: LicD family protein [Firmicutes bacterium]|nr:LicD family protein [Bacillota bacterium]